MSLTKKNANTVMLENFVNVDRLKAAADVSKSKPSTAKKKKVEVEVEEEKPQVIKEKSKGRGRPALDEETARISVLIPADLRRRAELTAAQMKFDNPNAEVKNLSDFVRVALEEKLARMGK